MGTVQPGSDPDVLIIGAGSSGAAVAWSLAEAGFRVVCLEQGGWIRPEDMPHGHLDWELHRLTDFNAEVAGRALGKVETITWETHDKFKADGVLTYPPDFVADNKYPLVLLIHGGPQSASTERFSPWSQLIAARGYVVFEPNYRGSDNLGNAYQRAIFKDQGDGPGKDVMAGLEAVKKRGFVDEQKIAALTAQFSAEDWNRQDDQDH